jgi:hypothetical protein
MPTLLPSLKYSQGAAIRTIVLQRSQNKKYYQLFSFYWYLRKRWEQAKVRTVNICVVLATNCEYKFGSFGLRE